MKVALGNRGMTVEAARQSAKYWNEWRALLHMLMIEFRAAVFTWFYMFFRTALPRSGELPPGEVGCCYMMWLGCKP